MIFRVRKDGKYEECLALWVGFLRVVLVLCMEEPLTRASPLRLGKKVIVGQSLPTSSCENLTRAA